MMHTFRPPPYAWSGVKEEEQNQGEPGGHGITGRRLSSSREPSIVALRPPDWGIVFYIRAGRDGSFHMYPRLGGPFQSLREAENAIARSLLDRRDPKMFDSGVSYVELNVRHCLYWPDGTRKRHSKSHPPDIIRNERHQLALALVDKYNEDHNLVEDLAHQLKEVLRVKIICDGDFFVWYHHINFTTTKTDGHGVEDLFFAEVVSTSKGEHEELAPSCLRMLEPIDSGTCYGCTNNESDDHMKHPSNTSAYIGGHVKFLGFGGPTLPPMVYPVPDNYDDCDAAEEARIRRRFEGEDPRIFDKFRGPYPGPKPVTEAMLKQWEALGLGRLLK